MIGALFEGLFTVLVIVVLFMGFAYGVGYLGKFMQEHPPPSPNRPAVGKKIECQCGCGCKNCRCEDANACKE